MCTLRIFCEIAEYSQFRELEEKTMLEITTHEYFSVLLVLLTGTLTVTGIGISGVHLARGTYMLSWNQRLLIAGSGIASLLAVLLVLTAP